MARYAWMRTAAACHRAAGDSTASRYRWPWCVRPLRTSTLVHIALCTSLCACGEAPGAHSHVLWNHPQKTAPVAFKVALLTPGPISDQAWNAAAYLGLLRIKDSIGAQ